MDVWSVLLFLLAIFLIGIFPLYILVKVLGGKVSILKVLVIKIAAVIITVLLSMVFGAVGPLLVAITLIVLYGAAFRMGLIRSFIAWLLEGVVLAAVIFLLGATNIVVVKWNSIVHAFQYLTTYL